MSNIHVRGLAFYLSSPVIPLAITAPACGGTITTAGVVVTWDVSPGTQFSYRFRVWSDVGLTTLVYDTGVIVTAAMTTSIPFFVLSTGQTYYARVDVVMDDGTEQQSDVCDWTTSFAPSVGVSGLDGVLVGACGGDLLELPGVELSWTQVVPGAGETFVQYLVRRREIGGSWLSIAVLDALTDVTYTDHNVMPSVSYEYATVWVATAGGNTLVSAEQSPGVRVHPEWDHAFVHDVADPAHYVRIDTHRLDEQVEQAIGYVQLAGRQGATAQIGEKEARRWKIPMQERPLKPYRQDTWADLRALIARQRTAGSILCARFGAARTGMFCQASIGRSVDTRSYEASLELQETHYEEGV